MINKWGGDMFFHDKVILVDEDNNSIYLIRKIKNEIIIQHYGKESIEMIQKVLANDAVGEFDIDYYNKDLYLVYKNRNKQIALINLDDKEMEKTIVEEDIVGGTFELNLINLKDSKNILYIEEIKGEHLSYNIRHVLIEDGKTKDYLVDKIETHYFINPLKIITDNNNIIIAYYYNNQICIKEFNESLKIWSATTIITDNKNKLYLDFIKTGRYLNLVYCDFHDENFLIKYERFSVNDDYITKDVELDISDYGNNTDPILLYHQDKLWIVWKGTEQLLSKYSEDNGKTFSDLNTLNISKSVDMVKYKYVTNVKGGDIVIHNSYGSYYPEISFMGFHSLH